MLPLNGNFVLTITRIEPDIKTKQNYKNISVKRKSLKLDKNIYIYCFNDFDNFCDFCLQFNSGSLKNLSKRLSGSSLYKYNAKYYLALKNVSISFDNFKKLHCSITEFATLINSGELFENKLKEYGKVVFSKSAISSCIKYFLKK